MDPILWPTQTTLLQGGKLVNLQEENPCSCWGRKNPMSHLSRMKNPDLPCPSIAVALRAYDYVLSSIDVRTPWEPLLPSPAHPKLGFTTSQLGLADRSPCAYCACCFLPYLNRPLYAISC